MTTLEWSLKDRICGVLSATAPLLAFVCAVSLYGNLQSMLGESAGVWTGKHLIAAFSMCYFTGMVLLAIENISSLMRQFEIGERLSDRRCLLFGGLVGFGALNMLFAAAF